MVQFSTAEAVCSIFMGLEHLTRGSAAPHVFFLDEIGLSSSSTSGRDVNYFGGTLSDM